MYQIDFKTPLCVHFIGIGGISMSGLAEILLEEGFRVSGSDRGKSALTEGLEQKGIPVAYGQRAENITEEIDLVIYTAAVRADNPEYAEAVRKGVPTLSRAELLGQLMQNYKLPIAIAGTHGKTTTTSMISMVLLEADLDPTISVGGILKEIGGNIRVGGADYFVTEACEYTNSFLHFFPKIGIILNIDADHLDFFKDLDDIYSSFRKFAELLDEDGTLIINADIPNAERITKGLRCKVLAFSLKDAKEIAYHEYGNASFATEYLGREERFSLQVPGEHNIVNALATLSLAETLGISAEKVARGFRAFVGTDRRFQIKGQIGGITVVDDYAHHPTEIKATLRAAAKYPQERVICVFQPHTYTRTKSLFHELAEALCLADVVVLADVYAAREKDDLGVSSESLKDEILSRGTECYYFPSFDEIENFLLQNCMHSDLLITMGAGDIVRVGNHILGN